MNSRASVRSPLPGCLVLEADVILHVAALGWDTWCNTWLQLAHAAALGGQVAVLTGSLTPGQLDRLPPASSSARSASRSWTSPTTSLARRL